MNCLHLPLFTYTLDRLYGYWCVCDADACRYKNTAESTLSLQFSGPPVSRDKSHTRILIYTTAILDEQRMRLPVVLSIYATLIGSFGFTCCFLIRQKNWCLYCYANIGRLEKNINFDHIWGGRWFVTVTRYRVYEVYLLNWQIYSILSRNYQMMGYIIQIVRDFISGPINISSLIRGCFLLVVYHVSSASMSSLQIFWANQTSMSGINHSAIAVIGVSTMIRKRSKQGHHLSRIIYISEKRLDREAYNTYTTAEDIIYFNGNTPL